jgi:8-oxo-dGTP pyrophosphatase MutT (NUDIX family)
VARHTRYQVFIVENHSVLLIKHREHASGRVYWVIPGGGLDPREIEVECVIREAREATNLRVEVVRPLMEETAQPGSGYRRFKTFLCRAVDGRASCGIEPEAEAAAQYSIAEVRWFDLRDERDWEDDLLDDPLTYPQLTIAWRELGYLGGEPGGDAWAEDEGNMKITIEEVRTLPPDLCEELMRASTVEGFTPLQWLLDE